jgi:hypothetical protein
VAEEADTITAAFLTPLAEVAVEEVLVGVLQENLEQGSPDRDFPEL